MGYRNVVNSPLTYIKFRLVSGSDSFFSPGVLTDAVKLDSRTVEIQDMQQPGFSGSVVVQKLEKIWTGEYTYKMWTPDEFADDIAFVKVLRAGMKKGTGVTGFLGQGRRARVWQIFDPRLNSLDVAQVLVESISPIVLGGPGKPWTRTIKFHEYKKPVQMPLLKVEPTAADKAFDQEVKALQADRAALQAELAKLKKGA